MRKIDLSKQPSIVLTILLFIYFIITLLLNIPDILLLNASDMLSIEIFSNVLRWQNNMSFVKSSKLWNVISFFLSFAVIYLGIRHIRKFGKHYQQICMVIIGSLICILFIALNYSSYSFTSGSRNLMYLDTTEETEEILTDNRLTATQRLLFENRLAKGIYFNTGRLINVTDPNGNQVPFMPNSDDIEFKKELDYMKVEVDGILALAKSGIILWTSTLLISILAGLFWPIRENNNGEKSNKRMHSNAYQR